MRRRRIPRLGLLLSLLATELGGSSVAACGSTDDAAAQPDAEDAAAGDRLAPELAEAEASCDPDADLMAKVRDAAIRDGASTTGLCVACAKSRCADAVAKCTANCQCKRIVGAAIECYLTSRRLGCVEDLADYLVTKETRQHAFQLLGCVQAECPAECATDAGDVGDASDDGA